MQKQIQHASGRGDKETVYRLQQRLLESEAARLLAVRRVAEENQGKDTAGVDGVKSLSAQERLAMASRIHPGYWDQQPPLPMWRVWVPKPGTTERRPLAILPMIDRCKQALVKLALEPEWEALFEVHCYGFRPGRSVHDALAAILVAIEGQPAFVLQADIEGAFDHVRQEVVLTLLNKRMLAPSDFVAELGAYRLKDEPRKRFLTHFEERLNEEVRHPLFGYQTSYRRCLELQARLLAKALTAEIDDYPPFLIK